MAKIKVKIDRREVVEPFKYPTEKEFGEFMVDAGWSDDPGQGKAILLEDGREVVSPVPHDPPVDFVDQPSLVDQVIAKLNARRIMQLQDEEEIDLQAEVEDFDVGDDVDPRSIYEVTMQEEFPAIPPLSPQTKKGEDASFPAELVPDVKPEKVMKSSKKPPPDDGGEAET